MTEPERLVAVETELRITKETVSRIEDKLDQLSDRIVHNYVPREEIQRITDSLRTEIAGVRQQRWYFGVLSALTASVITGLGAFFLENLGRK